MYVLRKKSEEVGLKNEKKVKSYPELFCVSLQHLLHFTNFSKQKYLEFQLNCASNLKLQTFTQLLISSSPLVAISFLLCAVCNLDLDQEVGNRMYGLEDPLDSPDFDPIAFINQNFPTGDHYSNSILTSSNSRVMYQYKQHALK